MLRGRTYESDKTIRMNDCKKVKRYRSAFTTGQINYLEKQFERCPYIGSATRKEVANLLGIPERAIKIWFQNRRMKEKKEINNKEYNIDPHINLTNNVEFAKDSLINVHSSQSANDHQYSLQSTATKHVDTTNCRSYYNDVTFHDQSRIINLNNETTDNRTPYKFKGGVVNDTKDDAKRTSLAKPANLIKYTLNKNYNNKNFIDYSEVSNKDVTKCKVIPKTTLKAESIRNSMLNVSTLPRYQDSPEDLSARNHPNVMIPKNHQGNLHLNSAYIPFCNTQDVCLSAGNVIWKPVNVLPAISPNSMPVTSERQQRVHQNNVLKCNCNCNCDFRKRFNYDQGNIESRPQYVIAIPYNNNFNILR